MFAWLAAFLNYLFSPPLRGFVFVTGSGSTSITPGFEFHAFKVGFSDEPTEDQVPCDLQTGDNITVSVQGPSINLAWTVKGLRRIDWVVYKAPRR